MWLRKIKIDLMISGMVEKLSLMAGQYQQGRNEMRRVSKGEVNEQFVREKKCLAALKKYAMELLLLSVKPDTLLTVFTTDKSVLS
ncbi:hypothetical protein BOO25_14410 [Vibrio navarrensis]|nr:hypothetical protein [Vibrio navarrensis]